MSNPSGGWPSACLSTLNITTGRPWDVRLRQHGLNLEERHLKRSRPAQHSCLENCRILWKEATYLSCLQNLSADPALKCLPLCILRSGRSCPNDMFYPVNIHHVSADGVSGVRILNSCVTILCVVSGAWSEFMALFMVCMILICGVFLELFFSLVAFNFSVPFSRYNPRTCSFFQWLIYTSWVFLWYLVIENNSL